MYFDKEFSDTNLKGRYTRTFGITGVPMQVTKEDGEVVRYNDRTDREIDQMMDAARLQKNIKEEVEAVESDMKITIFSYAIFADWMLVQMGVDMMYALFSLVFVFCYVSFHVRSCFLGACSMLNIVYSFPMALCIYRFIFRVMMYSFLGTLVIFIILGIAADQTFVFTDAWR